MNSRFKILVNGDYGEGVRVVLFCFLEVSVL